MKCNHTINNLTCNQISKKEYGGYCYKHRNKYLLKDNLIIINRFTGKSKDYTIPQLKFFYKNIIRKPNQGNISNLKKNELFQIILDYCNSNKYEYINNDLLIKCQSIVRKQIILKKIKYQGLGIINRDICKNDEDFYTYDPKHEIDDIYYFSYKDNNNNYWCFDIRSLNKLINMNYNNPYTMEPFSDTVKIKINNYINYLKQKKIKINVNNTIICDRKTLVKQSFVDIFSQIEYLGYSCNVDWILNLNIIRLKRLYKELEDIWNYRAQLSNETKCNIAPPNGRLFVMPVQDYLNCNVKLELQEILAKELKKILNARSISDMNLGFMYFIIGLSVVNRNCFMIHEWVQFVF